MRGLLAAANEWNQRLPLRIRFGRQAGQLEESGGDVYVGRQCVDYPAARDSRAPHDPGHVHDLVV